MRYGFVIDQDRCIGCHACTVACKEEHQVPLGVFRTWVKYIEKGEFPYTSRHFGVMRCNHCDSAPCVTICPTNALYRRSDGIIDFDNQRCIGCKSCMQACPYDALYIDPNLNTAAKCNFCAHRVEANLEPACVIVCPTQAILAGDLDDPASLVSQTVATKKVVVRKPHKGTQPKLFYVGIDGDLVEPNRLTRQDTYLFAEKHDERPVQANFDAGATREVYDVSHPAPWGWKIAAYLWTKSVAAGVILVAATMVGRNGLLLGTMPSVVSPLIALVALGVTGLLLIFDLKRPERFYYLLTKPNFRSWLVIGAYTLLAYGGLCGAWLVSGFLYRGVPGLLVVVTGILAVGSAGYSAFLFAQAKGRDLWQSPLFFWHLLGHAVVAGAAIWLLTALFYRLHLAANGASFYSFAASLYMIDRAFVLLLFFLSLGLVITLAEAFMTHASEDARLASENRMRGPLSTRFWGLAIGAGMILPLGILLATVSLSFTRATEASLMAAAAILSLAGIWWSEDLWIKAGQSVPLS
jgi:Fe-S-cluster-containing dehydrogenase component/formate-dependent nitrite reductase membrane component NrfD